MIEFLIFSLQVLGVICLVDLMVFAMVWAVLGFKIPTRTEYREHALGAFLGVLGGVGCYILIVIVCLI